MSRDRFLFFDNFKKIADALPDDLRLKFYDALAAYIFDEVEPEDPIVKSLIIAIKPSLDKEEKRGGNHNPSGQNQHNKAKQEDKEVKVGQKNNCLGQKEVKVGQSGQSFLETETRNKKQENLSKSSDKSSDLDVNEPDYEVEKINRVLDWYCLPKIKKLTEERKRKLRQRVRDAGSFDEFLGQMEAALAESSFLRGESGKWQASFDFFLQASSWQKAVEGGYADRKEISPPKVESFFDTPEGKQWLKDAEELDRLDEERKNNETNGS